MNAEAAAALAVDSDYERVCWRLAGFDARVSPEWVDGFLTGVLAGPRAIALDQWLPAMLGDAFARVFADPLDARQAQRALSSRWSELAQQLDAEVLVDDPHSVYLAPWIVAYEDDDRAAFVAQGLGSADEAADELRRRCAPLPRRDALHSRAAGAARPRRCCERSRRTDRRRLPGRPALARVLGRSRAQAIDTACRGLARPQRALPLRQRPEVQEMPRRGALTAQEVAIARCYIARHV
jgi:hypothetical protein